MALYDDWVYEVLSGPDEAPEPVRPPHGKPVLLVVLLLGGLAVIVTIALVVASLGNRFIAIDPLGPTIGLDPSIDYDGLDDSVLTNLEPGTEQSRFRDGYYATELPELPVNTTSVTPFSDEYPDATDWLHAGAGIPLSSLTVVFTDDPSYNCGLTQASISTANPSSVAGCYNPLYYDTLFMWWGKNAADSLKAFILQHELSHFFQWWDYYDTINSAYGSGLFADEEVRTEIMESDATCRVIHQWNVPAPSSSISVPCVTENWDATWITEEVESNGVTIGEW